MLKPPKKTVKKPAKLQASTRRATRQEVEEEFYEDEFEPNMKLSRAFIVVLLLHVVAVGGIFAFNNLKTTPDGSGNDFEPTAKAMQNPEQTAEMRPATPATAADPNTIQPAPRVPAAVPTAPAVAEGSSRHIVRSGENLTTISALYGVSLNALRKENKMENLATIRVGQELIIPPKNLEMPNSPEILQLLAPSRPNAVTTSASAATSRPEAVAAGGRPITDSGSVYVVEAGDNPYSIARKLNVNYKDLLSLNGIDDPKRLQIGQKLQVPGN